jgi:transposase
MSPAFIRGVADGLPNAAVTFDRFHAVKIVNGAVDQVRRAERKAHALLKGTRYICLTPRTCRSASAPVGRSADTNSQDRTGLPNPAGVPGPL